MKNIILILFFTLTSFNQAYSENYSCKDASEALENKSFEKLRLIISSIDTSQCGISPPFHIKLMLSGRIDILELFLTENEKYYSDSTLIESDLLFKSVFDNNIDLLKVLLKRSINLNWQDKSGTTALIYAIKNKQTKIVSLLLNYNANPNIKDRFGKTAMYYAKEKGIKDIVEIIRNKINE